MNYLITFRVSSIEYRLLEENGSLELGHQSEYAIIFLCIRLTLMPILAKFLQAHEKKVSISLIKSKSIECDILCGFGQALPYPSWHLA